MIAKIHHLSVIIHHLYINQTIERFLAEFKHHPPRSLGIRSIEFFTLGLTNEVENPLFPEESSLPKMAHDPLSFQ